MASQKVLLFTVAGDFADALWQDVCRWNNLRTVATLDAWSPDDWPSGVKREVDEFVAKLTRVGYLPPVLYRSEHVDTWSMGDVFQTALVKSHRDFCRQLFTDQHELIATWTHFSEQIIPDVGEPDETLWLYARINEAIAAGSTIAEDRLVLLVRTVLGGLWEDDEVAASLQGIPLWWTEEEDGTTK
jgi:hypothetical protein